MWLWPVNVSACNSFRMGDIWADVVDLDAAEIDLRDESVCGAIPAQPTAQLYTLP